jgi:hypothetical protein
MTVGLRRVSFLLIIKLRLATQRHDIRVGIEASRAHFDAHIAHVNFAWTVPELRVQRSKNIAYDEVVLSACARHETPIQPIT